MSLKLTEEGAAARRLNILLAARWCFLNFGFSKTSIDDISRRAGISRTLLYRVFQNKEEVFAAVFAHLLTSRQPEALQAAGAPGKAAERLLAVCRAMLLDPWAEMAGAPMASEFHGMCDRLQPEVFQQHNRVFLECVAAILGDEAAAEVFSLALDGLLADKPEPEVLEVRAAVLVERFAKMARR